MMENKMATYIRTRDGCAVSVDEALDECGVLKDGYGVGRSLMLRDSAGRTIPGSVRDSITSDSQRAYEERICSAWKQEDGQHDGSWQGGGNPPRNAGQSKTVGPGAMAHGVDPADDPRQNPAYVSPSQRAYEKRLSEAWKTA